MTIIINKQTVVFIELIITNKIMIKIETVIGAQSVDVDITHC